MEKCTGTRLIATPEGTKSAVDRLFNLKTNDSALIEAILAQERTSQQTSLIISKLSQFPQLVGIKLQFKLAIRIQLEIKNYTF